MKEVDQHQIALQSLPRQAPTDPQVIELLRDRPQNDRDEKLRNWAKGQLEKWGDSTPTSPKLN